MKRLSAEDQEWLWGELAHALGQQQPLPAALDELARVNSSTPGGQAAGRLGKALASGQSLSAAVAQMGGIFFPGAAAALEAGERSNRLAECLRALSEDARARGMLRFDIIQAVGYPVAIALAALTALAFISFRVVPMFTGMYVEMNVDQGPAPAMITATLQMESFIALMLPALALILLYLVPPTALPGRRFWDTLRLRFPVVGMTVRRVCLSQWCAAMGLLTRAQVPEGRAVRLAGESTGNERVAQICRSLADQVESGVPLGHAMETASRETRRFFPPPLTWMVRASEKGGGHVHVWPVGHTLYHESAERTAAITSVVLRIVFLILMVQIVAVTVLALLLPLLRLMNSLGG